MNSVGSQSAPSFLHSGGIWAIVAKPLSESYLFIGNRIIRLLPKETRGKLTSIFLGIQSVPADIDVTGNDVERFGLEERIRSEKSFRYE